MFDENLKSTFKDRKNLQLETLERLKEKNLEEEKLEEAFNFLKDNSFLILNCYNRLCLSLMHWLLDQLDILEFN
jgi:hypothetical protein